MLRQSKTQVALVLFMHSGIQRQTLRQVCVDPRAWEPPFTHPTPSKHTTLNTRTTLLFPQEHTQDLNTLDNIC